MIRLARPTRGVAALALGAAALCFVPAPSAADAASAAAADEDAITKLGACLASGGVGDVLLVMDTSGSLQDTDPDDGRVEAATYLVEQLADYAETSGADLNVGLGGFSDHFELGGGWTALDRASAGSVTDEIAEYADKDSGFETDYWLAAAGARTALADRAEQQDEGRRCQAWIWFSDGMLDLDARDSAEEREDYGVTKPYGPDVELTSDSVEKRLEDAARKDLCRPGGLADQLRSQQILTLAVGLRGPNNNDFSLMQGVATGSDSCGRAKGVVGQFIEAENIRDVLLAFDALSDPDHAPVTQTTPTCDGEVCEEGAHQFVLDSSISRVHIVGGADVPVTAVLTSPDGQQLRIKQAAEASTSIGGNPVEHGWVSEDVVELDLERKRDAGWVGQWQLAFVSAPGAQTGTARSNIHLYGDVLPTVVGGEDLRLVAGEPAEVTLGLVHADDATPVDPESLRGEVDVDAELRYADGTSIQLADGLTKDNVAEPLALDLSSARPGDAVIAVGLRLTTAGVGDLAGTELEPQSVEVPVTIEAPPEFPTVPSEVSFGTTEETEPVTLDVPLTGEGCAWLAESGDPLTLPEGVDGAEVTSSASDEGSCESGAIPLTLTPSGVGNGLASGDLVVMTRPSDPEAEAIPVQVRYELEMKRPRDPGFPFLVALITAAGVLIPLALLYLVKWRTAQVPGVSVLVGSLTGQVTEQSAPFLATRLSPQQLRGTSLAGSRRQVAISSGGQVRTRVGLAPTETGYAVVTGRPSVTSARPGTTRRGRTGRLPLAIQDHWVALLDPNDPHRGPVEVVFLVSPTSTKLDELQVDARNRVPELVTEVRSRLGDAPPSKASTAATTTDDWGNPVSHAAQNGTAPQGPQPARQQDSWDQW